MIRGLFLWFIQKSYGSIHINLPSQSMKGQQTFLCFVCSFGKNELLLSYRCRNNMKTGTIIEENVWA